MMAIHIVNSEKHGIQLTLDDKWKSLTNAHKYNNPYKIDDPFTKSIFQDMNIKEAAVLLVAMYETITLSYSTTVTPMDVDVSISNCSMLLYVRP